MQKKIMVDFSFCIHDAKNFFCELPQENGRQDIHEKNLSLLFNVSLFYQHECCGTHIYFRRK